MLIYNMAEMQVDAGNTASYMIWIWISIGMALVAGIIVVAYMSKLGLIGGG